MEWEGYREAREQEKGGEIALVMWEDSWDDLICTLRSPIERREEFLLTASNY